MKAAVKPLLRSLGLRVMREEHVQHRDEECQGLRSQLEQCTRRIEELEVYEQRWKEQQALDAAARRHTQLQPLELPLPPGGLFLKVKIDYPDCVKPRPATYVYPAVQELFLRHVADFEKNVEILRPYLYHENLDRLPSARVNDHDPYWNNGMFDYDDARAVYAMTAHLAPKKIIEVGSGNSTKFFRKAIRDFQLDTKLIAIDPMPQADIEGVADEIIYQSVVDVDVDLFGELGDGDILFWDGSHIVFNGTDATHFYLNILPSLKRNVFVHVHDICLPNEYNYIYTAHYYNEQYMLAALLLNSNRWIPVLPHHFLKPRLLVHHPCAHSLWFGTRHLAPR
jgi:hypothetical protein